MDSLVYESQRDAISEEKSVQGEGMTFTPKEQQSSQNPTYITYNRNIGTMQNSQIQQACVGSHQSRVSDNQAEISEKQVKIYEEQQKAKLKMPSKIKPVYINTGARGWIEIEITNLGETAANDVKYYLEHEIIIECNSTDVESLVKSMTFERRYVEIRSIPEVIDFTSLKVDLTEEDILKLKAQENYINTELEYKKPIYLLVWGCISYRDVFSYQKPFATLMEITEVLRFSMVTINQVFTPVDLSQTQSGNIKNCLTGVFA